MAGDRSRSGLRRCGLRFSLSHADRISTGNLRRLTVLGAGVVLDDHQVFKAGRSEAAWGDGSMTETPRIAGIRSELTVVGGEITYTTGTVA